MKMKTVALVAFSLFSSALFAAPAKGGPAIPVAEGYPAWTGVTAKNYVCGRQILSPSDLRQRVTIIVEFDATKAHEQLNLTGDLSRYNFAPAAVEGTSWETFEMPRDVMIVFVAHNLKDREAFMEAKKAKDNKLTPGLWQVRCYNPAIYENVTFEGAPSNGGKLPFVYVMGYEGKEPLVKEPYSKTTPGAISRAISAQKKTLMEKELSWRPYYGYVSEPAHYGKDIEKALAKGKPLDTVQAKILKGVTSHDPEVAKEAQMLYDALEQTRDDYIFQATCELGAAPHVAAYHMNLVLKYWPKIKKQFSEVAARLKANADAKPLITMYPKIRQWADPNFTCKNASEAKKIVAELNKLKKMLEPLKESKNVQVQNGAMVLDGMLDELIAIVPTKVPQK